MEAAYQKYASLDDIVFEGRNKNYGAYLLRQEYHTELKKATVISISTILLLLGMSYMAIKMKPDLVESLVPNIEKEINLDFEPVFEKVIKPVQQAQVPAGQTSSTPTEEFRAIRVVPDETQVVENIPNQSAFTNADPGLYTTEGDPNGDAVVTSDPVPNGSGTSTGTEIQPFFSVEQMPEFEGGLPALYKFINKNLKYPRGAQSQGLEGNVILTFVVNASGQISNIQVLKDIGGGAGEEAMRVVSKMPNWKPGIQNHRPVPVRFTLPIRFALD